MESKTNISKEEARASLNEIQSIINRTRKVIAHGPSSKILILWGIIWITGFSCTQFCPWYAGYFWMSLNVFGGLSTWIIAMRCRVVEGPTDIRVGLFWVILFLYAGIWFFLLQPRSINQASAYWATIPMFAYVMGGLWFSRFFIYLGLTVTLLTILGLFLLPSIFNLWLAITGGGSLILAGVYIHKNWK